MHAVFAWDAGLAVWWRGWVACSRLVEGRATLEALDHALREVAEMVKVLLIAALLTSLRVDISAGQRGIGVTDRMSIYQAVVEYEDSTASDVVQVLPDVVTRPAKRVFLIAWSDEPTTGEKEIDSSTASALVAKLNRSGILARLCESRCMVRDRNERLLSFSTPMAIGNDRASVVVRVNGRSIRDRRGIWINVFEYMLGRKGSNWHVVSAALTYAT